MTEFPYKAPGLFCRIGFHSKGEDYRDHYEHVSGFYRDGIGREHITVAKKCWECGKHFDHKYIRNSTH